MILRDQDIAAARSAEYLVKYKLEGDRDCDHTWLLDEYRRRKIRIVVKSESALFPKFATALHGRVRVQADFQDRSTIEQNRPLFHELVHYNQRAEIGRHRFNLQYFSIPRRRWAMEMPAYRQGLNVMASYGATDTWAKGYIDRVVKNLGSVYVLPMTRKNIDTTHAILESCWKEATA